MCRVVPRLSCVNYLCPGSEHKTYAACSSPFGVFVSERKPRKRDRVSTSVETSLEGIPFVSSKLSVQRRTFCHPLAWHECKEVDDVASRIRYVLDVRCVWHGCPIARHDDFRHAEVEKKTNNAEQVEATEGLLNPEFPFNIMEVA